MAGDNPTYLRATDAWIWYLEQDPLLRFTINGVFVLDRAPDFEAVVDRFDRATRMDPRFRQKLAVTPFRLAPPRWVSDPWFDLSYHVRRAAVPAPGTLAEVLAFARTSAMGGLDRDRPLWEATLLEGMAGGRAALVVKLNHTLTDGIGGLQVAQHLFDLERDATPPPPAPSAPEPEQVGGLDVLRQAATHNLALARSTAEAAARGAGPAALRFARDPLGSLKQVGRTAGSVASYVRPIGDTRSPVMTGRSFSWHFDVVDVATDDLKRAAKAAGGTLNDAFLAALSGGLRRYHEEHGAVPADLRVGMPVSLRRPGDPAGGNRVVVMRYALPVAEADPVRRMAMIHDAARAAREEPSVAAGNTIAGAMVPLTPWVVGPMAKHLDFGASNVPGYPEPVYLCGAQVLRTYPFGPTGGTASNITLISYDGTCCVGVNTDPAAVPDAERFHQSLADGFDEVLALGGEFTPAHVGSTLR